MVVGVPEDSACGSGGRNFSPGMSPSGAGTAAIMAASGLTVGSLFAAQVRQGAGRIALQQGEHRLSYAALADRSDRLAHHLASRGIGRGDRVAVLSENRFEYVETQLACARLGAVVACQNWRLADAELLHCLRLVAPALVCISPRHAGRLVTLDHGIGQSLVFGGAYEAALARSDTRAVPDLAEPEDGLVILYTSGTTGLPKGALISHRAMIARAIVSQVDESTYPSRSFVAWGPMFHMGSTDQVFATLLHGGKAFVVDGFDAPALIDIIARESVGCFPTPGIASRMLAAIKDSGIRPQPTGIIGGMADLVPRADIAELTALMQAPFRNSFGSTETGIAPASKGRLAIGIVPESLSKTQNSYCQLRLLDAEGRDVAEGEPGEVALRTPGLFSGYWGAPEETAAVFRDGWYHMGDLLRRNPDGTLDFVGRRKYLIKSGGENIYPAEIEQILLLDPRIADAVVVRRADARWGEVPVVFVVRTDPTLTADAVIATCRGRIANYKLPKAVHFLSEADVPRSVQGKAKRHELEAMLDQEGGG